MAQVLRSSKVLAEDGQSPLGAQSQQKRLFCVSSTSSLHGSQRTNSTKIASSTSQGTQASTPISSEQKEALERVAQTKARHQAFRTHIERKIAKESRRIMEEKRGVYRKQETPETKKKFRKSTLSHLVSVGKISPEQLRATDEIERVFRYLTSGLGYRGMSFDQRVDCAFCEDTPAWFVTAYTKRYKPWAQEHNHRLSLKGKSFAIVLKILTEGANARQLDLELGIRAGMSIELFQNALERYVEIAGWGGNRRETAKIKNG